jgi:hypothetical protein
VNQPVREHVILANGAKSPTGCDDPLVLNYLGHDSERNVRIGLPKFVRDVYHLPDRVLDLLEIASYVFAGDRRICRGAKDSVEYDSWSRILHFYIRVRDYEFWNDSSVRERLSQAIEFMTGDLRVSFSFEPGHATPLTSLFDRPGFSLEQDDSVPSVTLFSGGLDSLCGVVDFLTESKGKVVLVSHESRPGTVHTQQALVKALDGQFPGRVFPYAFGCTLKDIRASEETQRSRSFLYTAIAYAIASAHGENSLNVYENGVTSINLHRREDLMRARASRTTHPQTMAKLASLYSLIGEEAFHINLPFLNLTKSEVIDRLRSKSPNLIDSSVSCTKTFNLTGQGSHCGYCFQCVDRRIAAFAAEAEDLDHRGLYDHDIIADPIDDPEARTTLVDYVRQAKRFAEQSVDGFASEYGPELGDLLDYMPTALSDSDKVGSIWKLFQRHGANVKRALTRMRDQHDDVYRSIARTSLLGMISEREHLKPEAIRLADSIGKIIHPALGDMFRQNRPKDEMDLNQKLSALVATHKGELRSEHPTASFACARVVPDHLILSSDLLVEAKYVRQNTSPSKASEGIAADLTKYPQTSFILFVVYDPSHRIGSDGVFCSDIECKGRNRVIIIR